jgi:hypothetical protein
MKRILTIGLLTIFLQGLGQSPEQVLTFGERIPEVFRLFSDRSVYVAGEVLHARVFNLSQEALRETGWSRAYYLELVSPDGVPCSRTKLAMDQAGASGLIEVPADIPSGTYFLKGYTRWMRNTGPSSYQFLSVEIINPYLRKVLPVDTSSVSPLMLRDPYPDNVRLEGIAGHVDIDRSERSQVSLELMLPTESASMECCITVVREGALSKQHDYQPLPLQKELEGVRFLPEIEGITLSGKVDYLESGNPAPFAIVYLSSLGGGNEFYANYADDAGRFYFALPERTGETEYFISASNPDQSDLEIFVDQDFCSDPVALPSYPLETARTRPELVSGLSLNAQIREQYMVERGAPENPPAMSGGYFYGQPTVVIPFGDFIQLPTLDEYFTEVIPQVTMRRSEGKRIMRIRGEHPDLQFYDPLIMIDGVAVFDVESLLAVSPRYVERVELVTAPYIRGNVTFGGIIHLVTTNGNMGYIDLPSSGLLLNYQMLGDTVQGGEWLMDNEPGIPDVRNTLYWDPSVKLVPGETTRISFRSPHEKGVYEICIRGIGPDGTGYEERIPFRIQ